MPSTFWWIVHYVANFSHWSSCARKGRWKVLIAFNYFGCHTVFLLHLCCASELSYVLIGANSPRWGGRNGKRTSALSARASVHSATTEIHLTYLYFKVCKSFVFGKILEVQINTTTCPPKDRCTARSNLTGKNDAALGKLPRWETNWFISTSTKTRCFQCSTYGTHTVRWILHCILAT